MDGIDRGLSLREELHVRPQPGTFEQLPDTLEDALEAAMTSAFIRENLPAEILRNFFRDTRRQLDRFRDAEGARVFDEQYFLSE